MNDNNEPNNDTRQNEKPGVDVESMDSLHVSQQNNQMNQNLPVSLIQEEEPTIRTAASSMEEGLQHATTVCSTVSFDIEGPDCAKPQVAPPRKRRRKKIGVGVSVSIPEISSINMPEMPSASVAAKAVVDEAYEVVEVVHEWASVASIHGVPFMVDKHFKLWRKLIWAVLVILAGTAMVFQINDLVSHYRQYRIVTSTFIESPADLDFPEIVICNLQSRSALAINKTGIRDPKNEEELIAISRPITEFIVTAAFGGKELNPPKDYFTPLVTERGVCWKFNTKQRVSVPGAFPGAGRYSDSAEGVAGLYVSLHLGSKGNAAMVYTASENKTEVTQQPVVIANQNKFNVIGLKRTRIERVTRKPWSKCNASAPVNSYTRESCRSECWHKASRVFRNCTVWGDTSQKDIMDYCPMIQQYGNGTTDEAMQNFAEECDRENCLLPPCQEEFFSMQSSVIEIDSELSPYVFSFLSINYETMRVESITESRANTLPQLLASIGGAMGLFLGISTLSLVELVGELFTLRLLPRLLGDKRLYGLGSKDH